MSTPPNCFARLTGAEDAIVVNNCAAAILLVLAALSKDGEVLVSRGELIEIGDGFRIPEVMAQSGAILREVGTTNRTHIADYENAINDKTRMLLRVHPSNFQMSGFTDKPSIAELVELSVPREIAASGRSRLRLSGGPFGLRNTRADRRAKHRSRDFAGNLQR